MKKIAQFTLNMPGKNNNFNFDDKGYYISTPGQILELRIQAPAGTIISLSTSDGLEDDEKIIIGLTESYYVNLERHHIPISQAYFNFNFDIDEQLKVVIVEATYYLEEEVLVIDESVSSGNSDIDQVYTLLQNLRNDLTETNNVNRDQSNLISDLNSDLGDCKNSLNNHADKISILESSQISNGNQIAQNRTNITTLSNQVQVLEKNQQQISTNTDNIETLQDDLKKVQGSLTSFSLLNGKKVVLLGDSNAYRWGEKYTTEGNPFSDYGIKNVKFKSYATGGAAWHYNHQHNNMIEDKNYGYDYYYAEGQYKIMLDDIKNNKIDTPDYIILWFGGNDLSKYLGNFGVFNLGKEKLSRLNDIMNAVDNYVLKYKETTNYDTAIGSTEYNNLINKLNSETAASDIRIGQNCTWLKNLLNSSDDELSQQSGGISANQYRHNQILFWNGLNIVYPAHTISTKQNNWSRQTIPSMQRLLFRIRKELPSTKVLGIIRSTKDTNSTELQDFGYHMIETVYRDFNVPFLDLDFTLNISDHITDHLKTYFESDKIHYNKDAIKIITESISGALLSGLNISNIRPCTQFWCPRQDEYNDDDKKNDYLGYENAVEYAWNHLRTEREGLQGIVYYWDKTGNRKFFQANIYANRGIFTEDKSASLKVRNKIKGESTVEGDLVAKYFHNDNQNRKISDLPEGIHYFNNEAATNLNTKPKDCSGAIILEIYINDENNFKYLKLQDYNGNMWTGIRSNSDSKPTWTQVITKQLHDEDLGTNFDIRKLSQGIHHFPNSVTSNLNKNYLPKSYQANHGIILEVYYHDNTNSNTNTKFFKLNEYSVGEYLGYQSNDGTMVWYKNNLTKDS